ncbi:MAG: M20/M25/M40 family metallo-hydrolase [Oscillospiraceae bacterium]|nr:M20/M25/M40 family metallo-hydrolase [Oscillospiraceae bacterium]MBQ7089324.1 M20/M25/M40 family metallo-hydrolase [Clostridia bacterium]
MELFELLTTVNAAHGPAGDEGAVADVIETLAEPYADEITRDTMGNLIVRKKGSGPRLMFSAHMDSVGLIATHITKEGFVRCGRLGGVNPKEIAFTSVCFKNGVRGVFAKEEKAEFGKLKLDECYIDIGAKSENEAKKLVQVGDTAVYDAPAYCSGDKAVAPYMDNRISCAVLLKALSELDSCANDCYFVFSVQEEVGLRGAKTAAYGIDPAYGIAVDVTDVDDVPGSECSGTAKLGKGAAIKVMDSSVICHPEMVALLEQAAAANAIPSQRDVLRAGGTDAGVMLVNRAGVITGGISVPCRYIHTPCEMVNLGDAAACVDLVKAVAKTELKSV